MAKKKSPGKSTGNRNGRRKRKPSPRPLSYLQLTMARAAALVQDIEEILARQKPRFGRLGPDHDPTNQIVANVQHLRNQTGGCLPGEGERFWAEFWVSADEDHPADDDHPADGHPAAAGHPDEPNSPATQLKARAFRTWVQTQYLPPLPINFDAVRHHVSLNMVEYYNIDPVAFRILKYMVDNRDLLPMTGEKIFEAAIGGPVNDNSFPRAIEKLPNQLAGLIQGEPGQGMRLVF